MTPRMIPAIQVEESFNPMNKHEEENIKMIGELSNEELDKIWGWNSTVPDAVEICIHDLIAGTIKKQPDALAICSWDGSFTYAELDSLSTKLADKLVSLGIGQGINNWIPLCFEKSKWTPVAMLAVMKAGGASVAMDISQPEARLQAIIQQIKPTMILSSFNNQDLAERLANQHQNLAYKLVKQVMVVDSTLSMLPSPQGCLPTISPQSHLYIIFTSGSTGTPKGVIITHSNFATAIRYQQAAHGFRPNSRVYDFASYAFDVAWSNVLHTLTCGACLCIPSEADRKNDLVNSMDQFQITHADLTPSIARVLPRKTLEKLETLVLGGEKLPADAKGWAQLTNVKNPYGPCECTPTATIASVSPDDVFPGNIGKGLGLNTWIVDPQTSGLTPIGSIGELVLEGPLVGPGYVSSELNTSFIQNPPWLIRGGSSYPGRCGRLYRTGDLVRYNSDGSLQFIGRKDSQTKINGQRVELSDVEHHVGKNLTDVSIQVVAEVVVPRDSSHSMLIAFLNIADWAAPGKSDTEIQSHVQQVTSGIDEKLLKQLPSYMVPSAYVPLMEMPMTPTGKIDRRKLRETVQELDIQQLIAHQSNQGYRPPTTLMEKQLQGLWSFVLGIGIENIGADTSFLRIGGDSIAAMKLVKAARDQGLSLTVADIFQQPRLSGQAAKVSHLTVEKDIVIEPFSLMKVDADANEVRNSVAKLCGVHATQIQDVFPGTPLQEGLLALSSKHDGNYIMREVLELHPTVDKAQFRRAWLQVVKSTPILRTRIVDLGDGLMQTVIDEHNCWPSDGSFTSVSEYIEMDKKQLASLGSPLMRFGLVEEPDNKCYFVWTIHHALADGWSIPLILENLEKVYLGETVETSPPFQHFVRYVVEMNKNNAASFWSKQLGQLEAQVFPALPSNYQPRLNASISHHIQSLQWPREDNTPATAIRAAWTILQGRYTASDDVVFGATVTGRQAPVAAIERMTGPTIATVPVRVKLDYEQTVQMLLQQVQAQAIEMTAFEQMGLQQIRRLNKDTARACQTQVLLVVQPAVEAISSHSKVFAREIKNEDELGEFGTYAMILECFLEEQGVELRISFDSTILDTQQVNRIAHQLDHVLRQLCLPDNKSKLAEIEAASEQDLTDIWSWNATVPRPSEICIHSLISEVSRNMPHAQAVCSWDGSLTYAELDDFSTRLAYYLCTIGVGPGVIVPLCFEKSRWMPVAMLAVMKAGGASVAMDSSQPEQRLLSIIQQAEPIIVLSSNINRNLATRLTAALAKQPIVVVDGMLLPSLGLLAEPALPVVSPSSNLYVVFTSGSTGIPKGVMISHSNFASAIQYQQAAHGFVKETSRVYDFASYAFDVSWSNMLHTFTSGGCLCIPSDFDRKNDLAGSMQRFQVTHADLTPSIARILPTHTLQSLQTLVLGGEPLPVEEAKHWAELTNVKNPYGPSECTPTATIKSVQPGSCTGIGKGYGLNTWIVDPVTAESLAPVGSIGELWLEGPLVGAGYLSDPGKTASSFVENPSWLSQGGGGQPGRAGRLYRTGDLVQYSPDGSLCFVGRKDAQVKIHGQRVELSDIENHLARHASVRQAVCLYPKSGPYSNRLVGIFSLQGLYEDEAHKLSIQVLDDHEALVRESVKGFQEFLDDVLPTYMIPSDWIALQSLPLNISGKLDRKYLQTWLSTLDSGSSVKVVSGDCKLLREPETDIERVLQKACGRILNIPAAQIDLQTSFVANGGDSISAMRLIPRCRDANIVFSMTSLLKAKSLVELAQTVTYAGTTLVAEGEESDQPFSLSPIQQWFFDQTPSEEMTKPGYYCNQGIYVKFKRQVSQFKVSKSISRIVNQHSMLRARFQKVEGGWTQRVERHGLYHWGSSQLHSLSEVEFMVNRRHQMLDIEYGPIFAADLWTLPGGDQYLTLVAHHLVVDLVSWNIILDDLETLLADRELLGSLPFQVWSKGQIEKATSAEFAPSKVLSTTASNDLEFWKFVPAMSNTVGDQLIEHITIDSNTTSLMLNEANQAFNTEPVDIILAAVWDSFFSVFSTRQGLTIFNEGHGREAWSPEIDLSRTVGWFTTMSPIDISRTTATSSANVVRSVKDSRRRLPQNGWKYFTSRYFNKEGIKAFQDHNSVMEMVFNYHGQFRQIEQTESLFDDITLSGVVPEGPSLPASSLINIEASIKGGNTDFEISFNRHIAHQDLLRAWVAQLGPSLQAICNSLTSMERSYTLSDFEYLSLDYNTLEQLQRQILHIEEETKSKVDDVYLCSPMVDGILLSQIKQSGSYKTTQLCRISSQDESPVNLEGLVEAWQRVISHQPSLRTIFIKGMDSLAAFNQVVLRSYTGKVVLLNSDTEADALQLFGQLPPLDYQNLLPPHRLVLCQIANGQVLAQIEMSHAITDGASTAIIAQDWIKAYTNKLKSIDLRETSRGFATALISNPKADKLAYWKNKLSGAEPCNFSPLSGVTDQQIARTSIEITGGLVNQVHQFCNTEMITPASLFQSAWALTLASYVGTDSVCFGYLASGRDLPIQGLEESVGAYANMMTCRADTSRQSISSRKGFIHKMYNQILEDLGNQHCSLAEVQHELNLPSGQSLFNTILSVQTQDNVTERQNMGDLFFEDIDGQDSTEYQVSLDIIHRPTKVGLSLNFSKSCLSERQATRVLSLLQTMINFLVKDEAISQITKDGINALNIPAISSEDLDDIWKWNSCVADPVQGCVQDLISISASRHPDSPAICAWDGEFSYQQLDNMSTLLAHYLVSLDIAHSCVPLCFEKSKWTPVAMLAVIKAGGASVAMDSSQPEARLKAIVNQVHPKIILSSATNITLASRLSDVLIVQVDENIPQIQRSEPLPQCLQSDIVYVSFTSGSTGVPKGACISHSNVCSAVKYQGEKLGFNKDARVFDFAPYSFDVAWSNVLQTLCAGGCLCIPNAQDSLDNISESIQKLRASFINVTPSMLRLISPNNTSLRTVLLSGEKPYKENISQWAGKVRLINTYGPSECTWKSAFSIINPGQLETPNIGVGVGQCTWIVHPQDDKKLVPIGSVGELWLEGPLVGQGYLSDPKRTAEAFIDNPEWLVQGSPSTLGRRGRLYKTGDLVCYQPDGSLFFVGRKDSQIKIRGQRVELGEIEAHIRGCHTTGFSTNLVVEMVVPRNSTNPILTTFFLFQVTEQSKFVEAIARLEDELASILPVYMMPGAYVPLDKFPVTGTGKTDRRQLRKLAQDMTLEQLTAFHPSRSQKRQPKSKRESQLQRLWSSTLGIDIESIGADDSFFRLGGDSIGAMRFVAAAREQSLKVTVADVFKHPRLGDLAPIVGQLEVSEEQIKPFSLLKAEFGLDQIQEVVKLSDIDSTQIEDVFPCTPLQEGLLALTARENGNYVMRYVLKLQSTVNNDLFINAWNKVVAATPILRTQIVDLVGQGLVQVVANHPAKWRSSTLSLDTYLQADDAQKMALGTPLVRYGLVEEYKESYFILTIHHTLYDAWSIPLIFEKLERAYQGQFLKHPPCFQRFVKHIMDIDNAKSTNFWRDQLKDLETVAFPSLPSSNYEPKLNKSITHYVKSLDWPGTDITASTAVRAAWSILIGQYTASRDVVFGATVTGRQAPVQGIEQMAAPTIATVPIRVLLDHEKSVQDLLEQVQAQAVEMAAFEQAGLQRIRLVSPEAEQACQFQTLLVIYPAEGKSSNENSLFTHDLDSINKEDDTGENGTYAMTVDFYLENHALEFRISFDSSIVRAQQMERMGQQLEHILRLICAPDQSKTRLSDLETASEQDLHDIWKWNKSVPDPIEVCIHDLIAKTVARQPEVTAVCAWDGDLTYRALNDMSTQLAYYLASLGVKTGVVVPLFFEKSKWTPVAMLAVMKTGGTSVALDPSQPEERLRDIISQVQAQTILILSSSTYQDLAGQLGRDLSGQQFVHGAILPANNSVIVNETLLSTLSSTENQNTEDLPVVNPSNGLYVVFTSGSTGVPKGVLITHTNMASATIYQQDIQGIHSTSRIHDFASYAFDVAWANAIFAFTCGGCLCIPSDTERKNDLAGSIERLRPTHADMTPSLARILPAESLKTLQTMILGGEQMPVEDSKVWATLTNTKNAYGPSECTPTATVTTNIHPDDIFAGNIGKGYGVVTWVVNPNTGESLTPIGGIGELYLEGPLVGPGYLSPSQTSKAFIESPAWLLNGHKGDLGRQGRLYKTGDLVSYNPDGTLAFIGRKDGQVKVHGQRVELSDIENHMERHIDIRQAACIFPKSGPCAGRLVGIYCLESLRDEIDQNDCKVDESGDEIVRLLTEKYRGTVQKTTKALQAFLHDHLPSYMVPSVWIAAKDLPLNTSGKMNRKDLQKWVASMDMETFSSIMNMEDDYVAREPQTAIEQVLHDTCSRVLNVPSVNLRRSFVANGGDSISGMRLIPQCRAAGIEFSIASLLKAKSLADLAQLAKIAITNTVPVSQDEEVDKPFGLSPIQQCFFEQISSDISKEHYCNQGVYLKINRPMSHVDIRDSISKIVQQHSMLRARFQEINGKWEQLVLRFGPDLYHFDSSQLQSLAEVESLANKRHQMLDIKNGPVFSADLCSLPTGQYLILIAHHLVVDLVSWRIILDDLESLLTGGTLQGSLPFQFWTKLQMERAISTDFDPENVLPVQGAQNDLEFWHFSPSATPNTARDHGVQYVTIDHHTTSLVLTDANETFNTEPVDLLLAAVWDSFFQVFTSRSDLTIFNEAHGREPWDDIDLSRTVGWFTTMSPINVPKNMSRVANIVRSVKDARRQVKSNGFAYFTSRFGNANGTREFHDHNSMMEVLFNYHGQFQQLEHHESLFDDIGSTLGNVQHEGPSLPASSLFDIEVSISGGCTHFSFAYNRHIAHQDLISTWINQLSSSLHNICHELKSMERTRTLSDFEFLNLDYKALDELQTRIIPQIESENSSKVEDIFPCSPMVDGILLSQVKQPGSYKTSQMYEISSNTMLAMNQIAESWQMVIARQPSLRTVFITGMDTTAAFNHVILNEYKGDVLLLESPSEAAALEMLKQIPPMDYSQLKPPHRLLLCQTTDDGKIFCQLEMSHAITDGASTTILLEDWAKAFAGTLSSIDLLPTSREFVRTLKRQTGKTDFWKTKLANVEPCYFPHISWATEEDMASTSDITIQGDMFHQIQRFCEAQSITPASLFQSAWALTLSSYTGTKDSVCFGYLASGRDWPISGLQESIGAYASLMVCRTDISQNLSSQDFVQQIHTQVLNDLEHQHCSLADIQHELNLPQGQGLFNTIISFQKQDDLSEFDSQGLSFRDIDGEDPTEYEIVLGIRYGTKDVHLSLDYSPLCLSNEQATRVLSLVRAIVSEFTSDLPGKSPERATLGDLDLVCPEDLETIWTWNLTIPETINICVHDLIENVVRRQPNAQAICSWDGDFTYFELNKLSTKLAIYLVSLGVGPGVNVPLCFEKSKWTAVAMLAVMKAGGASVAMDSNQPEERLRSIVSQVQSVLVLSSSLTKGLATRLTEGPVLVVDETSLSILPSSDLMKKQDLPKVSPSSTLYIVFTSGSTGVPKGAMVTHSSFASAIHYQQAAHGFVASSRVYDFASYAFDVAWSNFLHTLTCGGCLCIPSDMERKNDLSGSIKRFKVTHADLTPSTAKVLTIETISQLQTLVLGGEQLPLEDARRWVAVTNVKNPYGPSECTPTATITNVHPDHISSNIGKGLGVNTWVVNSISQSLTPIGGIGELFLEGPLVGPGYLSETDVAKAAFVTNPTWLQRGYNNAQSGRPGRVYKTGDLVRYNLDGSLTFVGRKDTQVKINGQRVELGEVEYHIQNSLAGDSNIQVAAEVVVPRGASHTTLVAFLDIGTIPETEIQTHARRLTAGLDETLSTKLSAHMIPSAYIPVLGFPLTATGKTDRRQLRSMAEKLTLKDLAALHSSSNERRDPSTPMEHQLQSLWASVLGISADSIGACDSFLRMGGDSIGAMKLVGAAHKQGLSLTVVQVLKHPRLFEMASLLQSTESQNEVEQSAYQPFSLLPTSISRQTIDTHVHDSGIAKDEVQDILPVTDQQSRIIAMTYTAERSMLLYHTFDGDGVPNVTRIREACTELVQNFEMLRTVFTAVGNRFLQVILKHLELNIPLIKTGSASLADVTEQLVQCDKVNELPFGTPLTRFTIIYQKSQQKYRVVVRMSHAQHDGISLAKMWTAFENIYERAIHTDYKVESSFSQYMYALSRIDKQAATEYWRKLLQGSSVTYLKQRTTHRLSYSEGPSITKLIPRTKLPPNDFTFSTILKAAWAYVLARNSAKDDIVFGNLTHGRGFHGSQEVFGACVNVIPSRITFAANWTVHDLLIAVNTQQIASMPFEQFGSREIIHSCTNWPKWTYFSSVLHHENFDGEQTDQHERSSHDKGTNSSFGDVDNVEVHIHSMVSGDDMKINFGFAADVVPDSLANQLAMELSETIILFHQELDMKLQSPRDLLSLQAHLPVYENYDSAADDSNKSTIEQILQANECPMAVKHALNTAWREVLGHEITPEDNETTSFFDLGGDLVNASQLSANMERQGYHLSIEEVFENPRWYQQLNLFGEGNHELSRLSQLR